METNSKVHDKREISKNIKKKRARSKKEKGKVTRQILDAAKREFLLHGSEKTTMRNIANVVGMTVGNLYTYFSSKQELWNAIINEYFTQFTKEIENILSVPEQTSIQIFDEIAKMFFSFATSDPERFRMMFFVPAPSSKKQELQANSIDLTFIDLIRSILQKAIINGELKEEKVDFYANLFGAIGIGSILMISPELGNFGGGFKSRKEKIEFLDFVRSKLPSFFS